MGGSHRLSDWSGWHIWLLDRLLLLDLGRNVGQDLGGWRSLYRRLNKWCKLYLSGYVRWQLGDYSSWSMRLDEQGLLGIGLRRGVNWN